MPAKKKTKGKARAQAPELPLTFDDIAELDSLQLPAAAFAMPVEVDATFDAKPSAEGNRPFRGRAHSGAIMRRMTWDGPINLAVDMDSLRITRQDVPVLKDHMTSQPAGFTRTMAKQGNDLNVTGELMQVTEAGAEAIKLAAAGFPWQMSIYAPPQFYERVAEGAEARVNGQTMKGPGLILRNAVVREVTLCALGADDNTGASMFADAGGQRLVTVAAFGGEEDDDMDEELNEGTNVPEEGAAATATAEPAPAPKGKAKAKAEPAADQLAAARAEAAKAERERIAEVTKLGTTYGMDAEIIALAVTEGWSADRAARAFGEVLADAKRVRLAQLKGGQAATAGVDDPEARGRAATETKLAAEAKAVLAMPQDVARFKLEFEAHGFDGRAAAKLRAEFSSFDVFAAYRKNKWPRGSRGHVAAQRWAEGFDEASESMEANAKFGTANVLSPRNVRGEFFKSLEETQTAGWVPSLSHMLSSDQASEDYRFLGQVPAMRAWRGARRKTEPKSYKIQIANDKFENGVEFSRDDIRRDKTGQIRSRIRSLGARAAQLPTKTLTTLLEGNATAYDGVAFFGNHVAASVINNALTDSTVAAPTAPTSAEMMSGILAAVQALFGVKDDQGEPMNEFAGRFAVMVPVAYQAATFAALGNEFTSAGVSNVLRALTGGRGITIDPIVNPRLTAPSSTGVFYVFRVDSDIKPMIWQDEVDVEFDMKAEGSDYTFDYDSCVYGAKRIGAGALAAFEMSARMTFS